MAPAVSSRETARAACAAAEHASALRHGQSARAHDRAGAPLADGLYANTATKTLAPYVQAFSPKYPLWSDASVKNRWAYVPTCATIDTTNMDSWSFPVGTRFWKEFIVAGKLAQDASPVLARGERLDLTRRTAGTGPAPTRATSRVARAKMRAPAPRPHPLGAPAPNRHRLNARALGFEVVN